MVKAIKYEKERKLNDIRLSKKRRVIKIANDVAGAGEGMGKKESSGLKDVVQENMTSGRLREIVFELFAPKPFWTMKGLRNRARQPDKILKDILK